MANLLRATLGLALAVALLSTLSCSHAPLGVSPTSRYKVTERFLARPGGVDITGVIVRSTMDGQDLSEAELEKLGSFLAAGLRKTTIGPLLNLTGKEFEDESETNVAFILTIDIDMLKSATQEERRNRVPSHLRGKISMHRVASGKRLGTAHVWSQGSGLDLTASNSPDTVREFVATVRSIIQ